MFALLLLTVVPAQTEDRPSYQEKVAMVNGTAITREDLDREIGRLQRKNGNRAGEKLGKELRREALDNLVERELLWQESRRKGITVPKEAVDRAVAELNKSLSSNIETGKTLEEMNLYPENVRRETERRLAVIQLIARRLGGKSEPSEREIKEYYGRHPEIFRVSEKVRISHILVRIEPRWRAEMKEEARKRIMYIRERLLKGGDFASVAAETSDCPSGKKGGDLGWFSRGSLAGSTEKTAFSLPEGSVSDIVEDRYGFHLVRVNRRKPARTVSSSEGRPKIVEYLRQERMRAEARALAGELRRKGNVEVLSAGGE